MSRSNFGSRLTKRLCDEWRDGRRRRGFRRGPWQQPPLPRRRPRVRRLHGAHGGPGSHRGRALLLPRLHSRVVPELLNNDFNICCYIVTWGWNLGDDKIYEYHFGGLGRGCIETDFASKYY